MPIRLRGMFDAVGAELWKSIEVSNASFSFPDLQPSKRTSRLLHAKCLTAFASILSVKNVLVINGSSLLSNKRLRDTSATNPSIRPHSTPTSPSPPHLSLTPNSPSIFCASLADRTYHRWTSLNSWFNSRLALLALPRDKRPTVRRKRRRRSKHPHLLTHNRGLNEQCEGGNNHTFKGTTQPPFKDIEHPHVQNDKEETCKYQSKALGKGR